MTDLTKTSQPFAWTPEATTAFNHLKQLLTTAPILQPFDPARPTRLVTDASDTSIGGCLQQDVSTAAQKPDWRPVTYYSQRCTPAQCNYPVHDRELLALIMALKKWRHYLFGTNLQITACTDHYALQFLLTQPSLTGRQARWQELLAEYNASIKYIPGRTNIIADALSRRPLLNTLMSSLTSNFHSDIVANLESDAYAAKLRELLKAPRNHLTRRLKMKDDGTILLDGRIYIPAVPRLRQQLLDEGHDNAGHFGADKTYHTLAQYVYWPKMDRDIRQHVQTCEICQREKPRRRAVAGSLDPLPIPSKPMSDVSMDFITGLPVSPTGHNAIMVIVCRLTKFAIFVPCKTSDETPVIATRFYQHVCYRFGLPRCIVSDRDPKFTSTFWKELCQRVGTKLNMSSSAHPQTDGQTERVNSVLEQLLRTTINHRQDNWEEHLPRCAFVYNSAQHASTGMSPFQALYGWLPHSPIALYTSNSSSNPTTEDFYQDVQCRIRVLTDRLTDAQTLQKYYADKRRTPAELAVGDEVLLSTKHLAAPADRGRPSSKFSSRFIGPYSVLARIGDSAYRLQTPTSARFHNVFHVSQLKLYHPAKEPHRRFHGRVPAPVRDLAPHWAIDRIIAHRQHYGSRQYLVNWHGYPPSERTWLSLGALQDCSPQIRAYWAQLDAEHHL